MIISTKSSILSQRIPTAGGMTSSYGIFCLQANFIFFLKTIYSVPGDVHTPFWEHFCNQNVDTEHLDRFYGCSCQNWMLFHTAHPMESRTRHLWDFFHLLLVLASIDSGISTDNGHFLYIMYREIRVYWNFCPLRDSDANPQSPDLAFHGSLNNRRMSYILVELQASYTCTYMTWSYSNCGR